MLKKEKESIHVWFSYLTLLKTRERFKKNTRLSLIEKKRNLLT